MPSKDLFAAFQLKPLIDFASNVVLRIFALEDTPSGSPQVPLIKLVDQKTQLDLLIEWIDSGKLHNEDLNESQQAAVKKRREYLNK